MPFLRFHFVETSRIAGVSIRLTDRIQQAIGCPREHIVLEIIHSDILAEGQIKQGEWPLVEIDCFERPREVREAVAKIIYECLADVGYLNSDVHFRNLVAGNYYENGKQG